MISSLFTLADVLGLSLDNPITLLIGRITRLVDKIVTENPTMRFVRFVQSISSRLQACLPLRQFGDDRWQVGIDLARQIGLKRGDLIFRSRFECFDIL